MLLIVYIVTELIGVWKERGYLEEMDLMELHDAGLIDDVLLWLFAPRAYGPESFASSGIFDFVQEDLVLGGSCQVTVNKIDQSAGNEKVCSNAIMNPVFRYHRSQK